MRVAVNKKCLKKNRHEFGSYCDVKYNAIVSRACHLDIRMNRTMKKKHEVSRLENKLFHRWLMLRYLSQDMRFSNSYEWISPLQAVEWLRWQWDHRLGFWAKNRCVPMPMTAPYSCLALTAPPCLWNRLSRFREVSFLLQPNIVSKHCRPLQGCSWYMDMEDNIWYDPSKRYTLVNALAGQRGFPLTKALCLRIGADVTF